MITRKRILGILVGGMMSVTGIASACVFCLADGATGCTATSRGFVTSCHWAAPATGGLSASGTWHVVINRAGQMIELGGTTAPGDVDRRAGVFQPGDMVTAEARPSEGGTWVSVGLGAENNRCW